MLLKNKENPWNEIPAEDYEMHMSHPSVMQLQTLKEMICEQMTEYPVRSIMYLGVCTGNGLEFVPDSVEKIFGVDFNKQYLEICEKRFSNKLPGLELFEVDLNKTVLAEKTADLIIANLILEFVDTDSFIKQVLAAENGGTILSVIFQVKRDVGVISDSGVASVKVLANFHREVLEDELRASLQLIGYQSIRHKKRELPDGKVFVRIDFKKML